MVELQNRGFKELKKKYLYRRHDADKHPQSPNRSKESKLLKRRRLLDPPSPCGFKVAEINCVEVDRDKLSRLYCSHGDAGQSSTSYLCIGFNAGCFCWNGKNETR